MNKIEIMKMLRTRIKSCYRQLLISRNKNYPELYIEGFRSRLDELLLIYHIIKDKTFINVCKELKINYNDVNIR